MHEFIRKNFQSIPLISLLLISNPVVATEDETIKQLSKPHSVVHFGAGYLFNDNARFGQYSGVRDEGAYGIGNINIIKRNDDTGTWFKLMGRNLGFDNRDVRFEHSKQGNWGYFIDFSQTPRYEPFTVNTAVTGIGSNLPVIPASSTTGEPVHLKTERQTLAFGLNKLFPGNFAVQLHFRTEDKGGARLFGRASRLIPEPINYTTRIFGATVDYNSKQLQLSGGYYGTMFLNKYDALYPTGGHTVPLALPPDNQSHQIFLTGGYSFSPTIRSTFRAAYTRATQTDTFFSTQSLAPGIGNHLDGRIDTTLLQAGITSRSLPKLTLLTNFRFEDRDDRTALSFYHVLPEQLDLNANRGVNPRSFRTLTGKFEANYALPKQFHLIGGIDYEHWDRNGSATYVTNRRNTDEISYRAELRRSLAETITGTISYIHSNRWGSHFLPSMTTSGEPFVNLIAPFNLADRNRNKVRLSINWEPIEPLSLQVMMDESFDNYGHRADSNLGLQKGSARNYSLDAAYTFSEHLQAVAWFSRNETHIDQASRNWQPNGSAREIWSANLENIGTSFGIDINSQPTEKLEMGVSLAHSFIKDKFKQSTSEPEIYSVPNISHQLSNMKLFARYTVRRDLSLQLDYILNRFKTNEWTWSNWTYLDGSQLTQDTNQIVNFIGLSAYYTWQ